MPSSAPLSPGLSEAESGASTGYWSVGGGARPAKSTTTGSGSTIATASTSGGTRIFPIRGALYPANAAGTSSASHPPFSPPRRPTTGPRTLTNVTRTTTSSARKSDTEDQNEQRIALQANTTADHGQSGSSDKDRHTKPTSRDPTMDAVKKRQQRRLAKADSTHMPNTPPTDSSPVFMTSRFEHEETDGQNFVITGRDGVIQRCEDEEIHAPGAVQAYGVLIVADEEPDGRITVHQVSENARFIIGLTPSYLFHLDCLSQVLVPGEVEILRETLDALDERTRDRNNLESGPLTITLSGFGLPGTDSSSDANSLDRLEWTCHAAVHRPDPTRPRRFVLELELSDDTVNPLMTESNEDEPVERGGMTEHGMDPTEDELLESTVSMIKPLRALARAKNRRRSRRGQPDVDVVALLSQITTQLNKAEDLKTFLRIVASIFRELTAFHRCMVYVFDEDFNGRVEAEQVDWTRTHDLYLGLNFPASDIPPQARELYRINKVRLLYDRDQPTARICCKTLDEVENKPLDMTHCHLRAMSPIHIKYLGNMGVRASMSVSITAFGDLWGLVACHTYGKFGHRVSFPVRQFCHLLASTISRNVERLTYAKRLSSRRLINTAPSGANPTGYIVAKGEDLLRLFDADFGALSIADEAKIIGPVSNSQELLAVLEFLRHERFTSIAWTQDVRKDWIKRLIDLPTPTRYIAGALCVPLSAEGTDFIVFFRKGQLQEVRWAGNPYANKTVATPAADGSIGTLEPRKSFRIWSETVMGRCRAWTPEQLETGGALALVYGKFIAVWREQRQAVAQREMSAILLANASQEVRTPLNAIVSYLEQALDSEVSNEVRDNLLRSHAASRSLIHVINDLLDLTRTEEGKELFSQDPVDLGATIEDAVAVHKDEAARRGLTLEVVESPAGTPVVLGDRGKIRTILTSVVNNAVRHTKSGGILIEWGVLPREADRGEMTAANGQGEAGRDDVRVAISITDTGVGMSEAKLESIFREFEQISATSDERQLENGENGPEQAPSSAVGLGLALVARIIRNLGGQLRVESVLGQGSCFTCVLPFALSSDALITNDCANGSSLSTRSRSDSRGSRGSRPSSKGSIDELINAMSSTLGPSDLPTTAANGHNGSGASTVTATRTFSGASTPAGARRPLRGEGKKKMIARRSSIGAPELQQRLVVVERGVNGEVEVQSSSVPSRPAEASVDPVQEPTAGLVSESRRPSLVLANGQTTDEAEAQLLSSSAVDYERPALLDKRRDSPTHVSEYRRPSLDAIEGKIAPMRVLVVEDEMVNRMMIRKRLTKDGHEVVIASHGGEAVRLLETDMKFDIVLMDLLMPIMGGLEATRRIREYELDHPPEPSDVRRPTMLNGRLPILAFSASLPERERHTIVDAGFDGWLVKPLDFKRLKSLMKGADDAIQRGEDVYKPGSWERGGWLLDAPTVRPRAPPKQP